jgi:phosphoglycerate kinase
VLLLENVRFQAGETTGDPRLAHALATLGDVYINDAFGTVHRAHVSTTLLAHHFKDRLAGYLMQKELNSADKILKKAKKTFVAIIGGAKISDKIQPLARLLDQLDYLLVGGGVANTFQKALGGQLGASLLELSQVEIARQLVQQAQEKEVTLVLPADVVVAPLLEEAAEKRVVAGGNVPIGWMALDIGPKAQQEFEAIVQAAETILWCGAMGVFEMPAFANGTKAVALAMTSNAGMTVVGGGDSAAAVRLLGVDETKFTHISTGGGASLEFLEGKTLPGISVLEDN